MSFRWILLLSLLAAAPARAALLADVDAAVFQGALKSGSSETSTRNIYGGGVYLNADNKERIFLGATFLAGSASSEASAGTTSFSHQDLLLGFKWFIDRSRIFTLSAGYGVLCKANYKDPSIGSTEEWTGNSIYAKFTVAPELRGRWNVGLSLIYYQATFVKKETASTVSKINASSNTVVPGLSVSYRW